MTELTHVGEMSPEWFNVSKIAFDNFEKVAIAHNQNCSKLRLIIWRKLPPEHLITWRELAPTRIF